jgi:hypothetical protein
MSSVQNEPGTPAHGSTSTSGIVGTGQRPQSNRYAASTSATVAGISLPT